MNTFDLVERIAAEHALTKSGPARSSMPCPAPLSPLPSEART